MKNYIVLKSTRKLICSLRSLITYLIHHLTKLDIVLLEAAACC